MSYSVYRNCEHSSVPNCGSAAIFAGTKPWIQSLMPAHMLYEIPVTLSFHNNQHYHKVCHLHVEFPMGTSILNPSITLQGNELSC